MYVYALHFWMFTNGHDSAPPVVGADIFPKKGALVNLLL